MSVFDEATCPTHGWIGHAAFHEASHAVAAVERDIDFSHIEVLPPDLWNQVSDKGFTIGGLHVDPSGDWLRDRPLEGFEMLVAGVAGENAIFGHALDKAGNGDMLVWRHTMGLLDGDLTKSDALLGGSWIAVAERMGRWAVTNRPKIRAVGFALVGVPPSSEVLSIDEYDENRLLTRGEVEAVLASTEAPPS